MENTSKQEWVSVDSGLPKEKSWVLHAYAGVRGAEYGIFKEGRFWRDSGPESFPTTHWLPIPMIDLGTKCKTDTNAPAVEQKRLVRQFWSVTEYGVKLVDGYECKIPGVWWCPEVGYSLTEGYQLFPSESEALQKAVEEARKEYRNAFQRLQRLESILANTH